MMGNTAHFKFFSVPLLNGQARGILKFKSCPGRSDMVIMNPPLKGLILSYLNPMFLQTTLKGSSKRLKPWIKYTVVTFG